MIAPQARISAQVPFRVTVSITVTTHLTCDLTPNSTLIGKSPTEQIAPFDNAFTRGPRIPFLDPQPPRLSEHIDQLIEIERSGIFSNYGPTNTRLEQLFIEQMFGNVGHCLTVNNATTGLMIAIKYASWRAGRKRGYAILPSFTFAATAHAAIWAGLTPLLCDIESDTWLPDADAEDALLRQYGDDVSVVVPYATFGNALNLERYHELAERYGVGVVIDAAASLGSLGTDLRHFGTGFAHPVVYSMHATKTFATAEAGTIYCSDYDTIEDLRQMGNFGFSGNRTTQMPGLNSKLPEISALLAIQKFATIDASVEARIKLTNIYRAHLDKCAFQVATSERQAHQFVSVLLPKSHAGERDKIMTFLERNGIGCAKYFSPHLAEHSYFSAECESGSLATTNEIASRILSLPLSDTMTPHEVEYVCSFLDRAFDI